MAPALARGAKELTEPLLLIELVPGPLWARGPGHTMGLCVHPALPWSRAGQAGIWGQARNSFPWRGPPHPLPGCTAPWGVWSRHHPLPQRAQAAEWGHAHSGHWGTGTPESRCWTGLLTWAAFGTHYVTGALAFPQAKGR